MNGRGVFHLISFVLIVIGLAMGACWFIGHHYDDPASAQRGLLMAAGVSTLIGSVLCILTRGPIDLSRKDGFGIVTFGWIIASLVGALPFIFSGAISDPVSAIFETMSGFTTTGASVLSDIEAVPKGILFWRALTHWFGGMGVLVLCVAILPFLKVGGMQLYQAEMPGPSKDRLTPRIASTAKLLWGIYVLLSAVEAVLLRFGGMSWFDASCHTFATMATGGFSTRNASVAAYNSVYIDVVIIVFMFLAGTNFALHFRALRGKVGNYFKDPEFKFYLGLWLLACLALTAGTWRTTYDSLGHALRASFFQGTSILTTTGFVTEDFEQWPQVCRILLIMLMFVGGSAGSTGGGMKNIRIFVVLKSALREIRKYMQPQAVITIKLGKEPVEEEVVSNIRAFFGIFVLIFAAGTFLMAFFTPDIETAFSSVIATLGNIGPGLSGVGAVQNYSAIPATGKVILTICMLLGRLELYTVLVMVLPGFWKK